MCYVEASNFVKLLLLLLSKIETTYILRSLNFATDALLKSNCETIPTGLLAPNKLLYVYAAKINIP